MKGRKVWIGRVLVALLALGAAEASLRKLGDVYLARSYRSDSGVRPQDITVVCLGESTTAGLWVDFQDSYPQQLERKLRSFYRAPAIKVVNPPHVGQNSSQIANRTGIYVDIYRPRLVIAMMGVNNQWSLAESSIVQFLSDRGWQDLWVPLIIRLEGFRLYRMSRWFWLRLTRQQTDFSYVLGHPEYYRWPPEKWTYEFTRRDPGAVANALMYDLERVIKTSRASGSRVLLMSYHVPFFFAPETMEAFAAKWHVPLVRNDRRFEEFIRAGTIGEYILPQDNWHPNGRGYSVIAENAFQAIVDGDLLSLNASARAGAEPPGERPASSESGSP